MRLLGTLVIICFLSCDEEADYPIPEALNEETVLCFIDPEIAPEFPGGFKSLHSFIKAHLNTPQGCIEGRVFVKFVVEKDGSISDVEVVKGISEESNLEAMRVVSLFPKFIPGKLHDIPVRTSMIIPIQFSI